jgi:hypothetical protein
MKIETFNIISQSKEGKVIIDFGNNEKYEIDKKSIRQNRVIIYKTSNGKIIVQNPDKWRDIDFKSFGIKELRFNLQNFEIQEGKAALHRWTLPDGMLKKLSPIIKLLIIGIVVGVACYAMFSFAGKILSMVMSSRLTDCISVLPKIPNPLGINETINTALKPLGT